MARRRSRPQPASSRIPSLRKSSWRPATKHQRCYRRWPAQAEMASNRVVLVIDNYDSFTYNLVQYLGELGEEVLVRRNDEITLPEVLRLDPVAAVLSPGPGTPADAGLCQNLLLGVGPTPPTLGGCLGHQYLGPAFRAKGRGAAPRLL